MNLPIWIGYLVFFLLPIALWLFGAAVSRRKGFRAKLFAFIAGSDNRLSLSRLQAFIWTLVIFGSFAGAMAIHIKIVSDTPSRVEQAKTNAKESDDKATSLKADAAKAAASAKNAADAQAAAESSAVEAEAKTSALAADPAATAEARNIASALAAQARADAKAKAVTKATADKAAAESKAAADKAATGAREAEAKAKGYNWVEIPAALLALAGIAIGSGVFSSLISALNNEDKTACVTALESMSRADLKAAYSDAAVPTNNNCLVIRGKDLGKKGKVQLDRSLAPILLWKEDGTTIIVDAGDGIAYQTLTVETANGKLSYKLSGQTPGLVLGLAKLNYELSDLFRDDRNPDTLDLMKFQMFGWTVVAVIIYIYLFLSDFRPDLESLPVVPASIVVLTGLSQGGYLSGKAVSNLGSNDTTK